MKPKAMTEATQALHEESGIEINKHAAKNAAASVHGAKQPRDAADAYEEVCPCLFCSHCLCVVCCFLLRAVTERPDAPYRGLQSRIYAMTPNQEILVAIDECRCCGFLSMPSTFPGA